MLPTTSHRSKPKRAGNPSVGSSAKLARGSAVSFGKGSLGKGSLGKGPPGKGPPKARAGVASLASLEEAGDAEEANAAKQSSFKASPFKQSIEKVRAVVEPILAAHNVDFVEISWVTDLGSRSLRVTIERAGVGPTLEEQLLVGFGVSLEDCVEVSRDISAALDLADVIPHAYNLEVSSPGLDRPLRHVADFIRFQGQLAKLKLRTPASDGQRVLRGRIEAVVDESSEDTGRTGSNGASSESARITMLVDGKRLDVLYGNVDAANLVYELPTQPKPNQSKQNQTKLNPAKVSTAMLNQASSNRAKNAGKSDSEYFGSYGKPEPKPHAVPGKPSRFSRDGLKVPKKAPSVDKAPKKGTGPKRGKSKGER